MGDNAADLIKAIGDPEIVIGLRQQGHMETVKRIAAICDEHSECEPDGCCVIDEIRERMATS